MDGSDLIVIPNGLVGKAGEEEGVVLAFRDRGNEVLFASIQKKPLRWIAVGEFTVDPDLILGEVEEEEPMVEGPPQAQSPFGAVRHREH